MRRKENCNMNMNTKGHGGNMSNIIIYLSPLLRQLIIATLTICIIYILIVSSKKHIKTPASLLTSSTLKFTTANDAHGILFGKMNNTIAFSPVNNEGHIAVFGGSGSGKTSALLIPTLRSWMGTSLVIDISGDISSNCTISKKIIFEPANPHTIPYNIFAEIDQTTDITERNEKLEHLAYMLMPDSEKMDDNARFFLTEGRKILTAALIAFYSQGLDFIPICEFIMGHSFQNLFYAIDSSHCDAAIQYINSFQGANEKNTAGCKQSADNAIKLFATNAKIKKCIHRPIKHEPCFSASSVETSNVFVIVDDVQLELYAPLLHVITAQCLNYFNSRPPEHTHSILLALDEFASFGKLDITSALRKLRKRHVRIMILTQSMADIDLIYGRAERMAMMNNFQFKVILGASDTDTQEYFAKLIGNKIIQNHSISRNAKTITRTYTDTKEYAIEPAELAHLKNELLLLYPDGYIRLSKNFYFL